MRPAPRDLLLPVALTAAVLGELVVAEPRAGSALAALAVLALALRRTRPLSAMVVLCGAVLADAAVGGVLVAELHAAFPVVGVACFVLGLHARAAVPVVAGTVLAVLTMTAANQLAPDLDYPPLDDLVFFALLLGTPAVVGLLLRRRADDVAQLAARAAALQASRTEQAAAVVVEERARVALGVHDALAHRIGEMALQAAGARRVVGSEPDRALAALASVEATGRAALDDIRDVVGVLRHGDGADLEPVRAHPTPLPDRWVAPGRPAPAAATAPPRSTHPVDGLIAVVVFLALAVETLTSARLEGAPAMNVLGTAAIAAPLLLRRRRPLLSVAGVYAAAGVQGLLLTPPGLLVTPIVLLLVPPYSVAAHLPPRRARLGLAICVVGALVVEAGVETVVVGALAWVAGALVRDRSRRADELRVVTDELERTGDASAARTRAEERLRIARELHDAVAHGMTVVVLQAGAAQRVWAQDPAAARAAIAALTDVARATLAELRVTLRDGTLPLGEPLEALAARVRPLGVAVDVTRDPGLLELPDEVERVVRAIVQEALTNAVRHAAPTTAEVRLERVDDAVRVAVADCGRGAPSEAGTAVRGAGAGLIGMAERVAALGGELRCGPHGDGFRVTASLPLVAGVPT